MDTDKSINIPIGTSFDNKGIVSAEKAFSKFGTEVNNALKRLGSDKSMTQLGDSVRRAFDEGLKGSENLLEKMTKARAGALDATIQMDKLTKSIEKQQKALEEAYGRVSDPNNENSRAAMRLILNQEEKAVLDKYLITKEISQKASDEYMIYKNQNAALLEGLGLMKKFAAYQSMERAFAKETAKYEEEAARLKNAHEKQKDDFWKSHGFKNSADAEKQKAFYDANGNATQLQKDWEALQSRITSENDVFGKSIPKASEELEDLRREFRLFIEEYSRGLNAYKAGFDKMDLKEQVKVVQSFMTKVGPTRWETDMQGVQKLTTDTVNKEEELRQKSEEVGEEYKAQKQEVNELFVGHADQLGEIQDIKDVIEQQTEELKNQQAVLDVNAKKMLSMANSAEQSMSTGSEIPANDYEDVLKKVFSWQRVFTIIGKLTQQLGEHIQDLSHKMRDLLINIGKLGVAMMKTLGTGAIKGAISFGKTLGNIKKRFLDMLPSIKQVARFLVKYIFGFRTMYFLVRKVRKAIGEGFKAMAKVDESVNKSISALQTALNQLKGQIGASFAPLLNAIAPVLVNIINLATKATVQIGAFLATLMGQHTFKVAIAENVDYAASLDNTADSAGKAAKALKAYLSPLDELNRMDDPDSGSGGGGSGAGTGDDLAVRYKDIDVNTLGISEFAKRLKEAWLNQDWEGVGTVVSDKLEEVFDTIGATLSWKNVESKIGKVTDIVSGIINGISDNDDMWKSLGSAIGKGISTAIKSINLFVGKTEFDDIGSGFATAIGEGIKQINPKDISKFLEDKFTVVLDLLLGFMDRMKSDNSWRELAVKVMQSINGVNWYEVAIKTLSFAGSVFSAITQSLSGFISQGGFNKFVKELAAGINDSISKLTPDDFKKAGETVSSAISVLLSNIGSFMNDTNGSGKKLLEGIKTFFLSIDWKTILTQSGDIAVALANGLIDIFGTIGEILNEKDETGVSLAQRIGVALGKAISQIDFEALGEGFGDFGEAILEGIVLALYAAKPHEKIMEFIKGVFSADAPLVQAVAVATPWLAFAGAIISGIGKAIPLALSANQATGGKLASMIGSWFSGGAGAGATGAGAAAGGAGKTAILSGAATGVGAGAVVFGALGSAAMMAALAISDLKEKQEDWAWGAQEIFNADSPLLKFWETLAGGIKSIPEAMGNLVSDSVEGWTGFFEDLGKAQDETNEFTDCTTSAKGAWESLTKKMSESGVTISSVTESIKTKWNSAVSSIREKLGTLPGKAKEAWTGIKNAFGSVAEWFEEKFKTAWEKVKEVFSTGGQIFSGIKEGIEATFKTVVNKIIDGMNKIIKKPFDKLNEMITKLKGIDVMGVKPFSSFKTISVPQIPKLAQGAVIPASKPFLAMLGDQKSGNNLEAPESLLRQIVREESGNNGGTTTVVAKVGRRELFEIVIEEAKIRQQATGKNPFEFT